MLHKLAEKDESKKDNDDEIYYNTKEVDINDNGEDKFGLKVKDGE